MANSIGIDFGTTKTMVSFLNPVTGKAELVRLGRDRDSIPTTVHQDENGELLFGEDADDLVETDPEGYCRAFKLHLGENDPVLPRMEATAESLTRRFLAHIKNECEQNVFHGKRIDSATITIPVSFSPSRKAALKRAAEAAGFSSVTFMPEPEAAGTAFLRDNPSDSFSRALVLDWGGGTLDIAIISRGEDGTIHADRHCAEGRDDVGGEEMDRLLLGAGNELWRATFGLPLIESEENEPKLLREAEKVKIGLSHKDTVPFRRGTRKTDVSRTQFKQLIGEMLDSAVELVKSALAKNKNQGNPAPDAILLIGGTCQIPAVRETMETNFPELRVLSWHHSHEAVALGATEVEANAKPRKIRQSPRKNFNRDSIPTPKKNKGHFEVVCPHCGNKQDVTGKGLLACGNCGRTFEVGDDSHTSNPPPKRQSNVKVDKVGKPGKKDFPIPDEALRLFRKLAEADVPCNQKEVEFMEAWCLGSTAQPAWKKRPLKREPIEDLARATAQAYHHDGEKLSALESVLCAFAECDGPVIDQREENALSWTKYGLAGKRDVNASRFKSPQHPPPVPPQFRRETTSTLPKKSLPKKGDKPPINLSVRSGLVGGYVLKVRNMSQKRMSLHIESMHWPDEDIKADITLEGAAETEVGWMEVNAARNFRAGETGTISSSLFIRALKFSITNSGGLRMS